MEKVDEGMNVKYVCGKLKMEDQLQYQIGQLFCVEMLIMISWDWAPFESGASAY
tara:strand:+ start:524 stop:685 length:162 start_codon:yes stop_codon:yes gene_type:complete